MTPTCERRLPTTDWPHEPAPCTRPATWRQTQRSPGVDWEGSPIYRVRVVCDPCAAAAKRTPGGRQSTWERLP